MHSKKIKYYIHDLVEVIISPGVSSDIIDAIDFQIKHFKKSKITPSMKMKIVVQPYEKLNHSRIEDYQIFHLVRGVIGSIYDDPSNRVAFEKTKEGFRIFADVPNFLINIFIQLWFIENGISMVHAAAVADESGKVTIFPGAGGVGKTAILAYMVKEKGFYLLGDDIVGITRNGSCLSFPRSFVLKEYHREIYPDIFYNLNIKNNLKRPLSDRFKKFILENAPFVGISRSFCRRFGLMETAAKYFSPKNSQNQPYLKAVSAEYIFGQNSVRDYGTIDRIIFMQRYSGKKFLIHSISEQSLSRRMFAIINHEWVDSMRQFFSLGALEIIDLQNYFERVDTIIRAAIRGKKCEIISIPNNVSPRELALYFSSII